MTEIAIEKVSLRDAFDFVFDFFEILIVFVIVSFELSLSNESSFCKFLFFLESDERELRASAASAEMKKSLGGISHPPYKDDSLYCSINCFGDNPILHEIVT